MKEAIEPIVERPAGSDNYSNRKLIRPSLSRGDGNHNHNHNHHNSADRRPPGPGGKKTPPAETTHAENFYYQKQMQSKTAMVVVLRDGEEINGIIEWYDRNCIKVNRTDGPNLMVYKPSIKYMYKHEEEKR